MPELKLEFGLSTPSKTSIFKTDYYLERHKCLYILIYSRMKDGARAYESNYIRLTSVYIFHACIIFLIFLIYTVLNTLINNL